MPCGLERTALGHIGASSWSPSTARWHRGRYLVDGERGEGAAQAGVVLEEAAAMHWDPAGNCDAGVCMNIAPENMAPVCQHICQS